MSAVVRTDEWPRRAETVARSTPSANSRLAWLCRRTWSDAPLGRLRRGQSRDTVDDTEFGINGDPSGRANSSESTAEKCAKSAHVRDP